MKLLIGGKSRNIYMRKDGSAYYKSGGQQVDVTHMFKKNGGGLKKKYIKGGVDSETKEEVVPTLIAQEAERLPEAGATENSSATVPLLHMPSNPLPTDLRPEQPPATRESVARPIAPKIPRVLPSKTTAAAKAKTELEVSTNISALNNFPSNSNNIEFYQEFFDLAQLVISVTNNLYNHRVAKIVMKTQDKETAEKQVTKLNAIINFFRESLFITDGEHYTGIFYHGNNLKDNFNTYKKIYLNLSICEGNKFIIKKSELLNLLTIIKIVDAIGLVAYKILNDNQDDIKNVCNNISEFLKLDDLFKKIIATTDSG
jgi:hypothetical protein